VKTINNGILLNTKDEEHQPGGLLQKIKYTNESEKNQSKYSSDTLKKTGLEIFKS